MGVEETQAVMGRVCLNVVDLRVIWRSYCFKSRVFALCRQHLIPQRRLSDCQGVPCSYSTVLRFM